MGIFNSMTEEYQGKVQQKQALLHSLRMGYCEAPIGMTKEEAIRTLLQEIADYQEVIRRIRGRDYA
jgi:hypothetical protein